jgi:hypothetical protein
LRLACVDYAVGFKSMKLRNRRYACVHVLHL